MSGRLFRNRVGADTVTLAVSAIAIMLAIVPHY
jgi:hypothetical protein